MNSDDFELKYVCVPGWWNGLHASLKNLWEQSHEGSTPSPGTMKNTRLVCVFFIVLKGVEQVAVSFVTNLTRQVLKHEVTEGDPPCLRQVGLPAQ